MQIFHLVLILIVLIIAAACLAEFSANTSRVLISIFGLGIIWASFSFTVEKKEQKYMQKIPVCFQGKIAFSTYEDKLINCSEKFKIQFNPSDSIFVYQEQDSKELGLKFSGGDLIFLTKKQ